jgi:hypothetical protein
MNPKVRYAKAAVLLLGAIAAGGCDMLAEPDAGWQVIGIIAWEPVDTPPQSAGLVLHAAVVAPDTVLAGVPFTVTITTVGVNACWRQDGAAVAMSSPGALLVTPLDRVPASDGRGPQPCTGSPLALPRTLQLLISQPGTATLRVQGRRVVGGDVAGAATITLEQPIVVL